MSRNKRGLKAIRHHRTVTHWPLLGVLLIGLVGLGLSSLPEWLLPGWLVAPITLGFLASYLTHIAVDACTVGERPIRFYVVVRQGAVRTSDADQSD